MLLASIATQEAGFLLSEQSLRLGRFQRFLLAMRWRKWATFDEMLLSKQLTVGVETNWRLSQAQKYRSEHDITKNLNAFLILLLPVFALEGFTSLARLVEKKRRLRPNFIFTAIGLHTNLFLKVALVIWTRLGAKLIGRQHGGGYGADFEHIFEMYETSTSDYFYTWGWKPQIGKSSVLSPPVTPHKNVSKKTNILLNCVDYPSNPYRLHYQPIGSRVEIMRNETCKFLKYIEKNHKVTIRPYQRDYSGSFIQKMKLASRNIVVQRKNVPAIKAYSQSNLVVHNYLGTAFLETLALDVPTICFYDKGAYKFRRNDLFEMIEEAGIIHKSSKSAAGFVIGLDDKVADWWNSKKLKDVKTKFLSEYCNFSSDWILSWEKELFQLQSNYEKA